MRNNRTKTWEFNRWTWLVTGEHVVRSTLMGSFTVSHRPAYSDFVSYFCGFFKILTEMNAWYFRLYAFERTAVFERGVRLGVETTPDGPCHRANKYG
jgi:hypothetical protein